MLELGGNAPVIAPPRRRPADAAATIAAIRLYNAGQECMAATRVLVDESVADELLGLLRAELEAVVLR